MNGEGKVCDRCGAALRPTLRFCTECGQIVAPVTTYAELTRPLDDTVVTAPTLAMRPAQYATAATPATVASPAASRGAARHTGHGWRSVIGGVAVFLGLIVLLVAAAGVGVAFRDTSEPLPFISATLAQNSTPDFKPLDPTTTFAPSADAFHLTFVVIGAESEDVLRSVWIAADVGDAAPRDSVIDEATITLGKRDESGSFRLQRGANPWPAGDYQVKLYVNDRLAQTLPFSVAR